MIHDTPRDTYPAADLGLKDSCLLREASLVGGRWIEVGDGPAITLTSPADGNDRPRAGLVPPHGGRGRQRHLRGPDGLAREAVAPSGAGASEGVCDTISGPPSETGKEKCESPLRKFSVTGSTRIGSILLAQCSPTEKETVTWK